MRSGKIIVRNIKSNKIVSTINLPDLHKYILNKISFEFSEMVKDCYYPKIANIYKELLHKTSSTESDLITYSKEKYKILPHSKNKNLYRLLYDPYTTLLIIIIQEFLKQKDIAGAESTFHLFALRQYTNLLYRYTTKGGRGSKQPLCVPEYFRKASDSLSKNHIFNTKKTIANSIMYYSRKTFQKYLKDLQNDDASQMALMIYEMRSKLNQSMRSFFDKYYKAVKEKDEVTKEEEHWDETHETQLKYFITKIVRDICIYKKIDESAIKDSIRITKFNQRLSVEYANQLSNPQFSEDINLAYYLFLRPLKDLSLIKDDKNMLKYVKTLMAIKTTKQKIYFKRIISSIHNKIIEDLNLTSWYNKLSIQSKSISRNFIAYYLALFLKKYI